MTDTKKAAEREAFEKACADHGFDHDRVDALSPLAWEAWQWRAALPSVQVPSGWKLVPDESNMTDEQAEAIAKMANCCGGIAYDIYRVALAAAPQGDEK